jgi:hypothetical protein
MVGHQAVAQQLGGVRTPLGVGEDTLEGGAVRGLLVQGQTHHAPVQDVGRHACHSCPPGTGHGAKLAEMAFLVKDKHPDTFSRLFLTPALGREAGPQVPLNHRRKIKWQYT